MAARLAARILAGETFTRVREAEGGDDLIRLARLEPSGGAWLAALEDADTRAIIEAISEIGTAATGITSKQIAFREAARTMVEQKLTDRMINKMNRLEWASNRLAIAGLMMAAIIATVEFWFV